MTFKKTLSKDNWIQAASRVRYWIGFDEDIAIASTRINKKRCKYIASLVFKIDMDSKKRQLNSEIVSCTLIGILFFDQWSLAKIKTLLRPLILKFCNIRMILGFGLILPQSTTFDSFSHA